MLLLLAACTVPTKDVFDPLRRQHRLKTTISSTLKADVTLIGRRRLQAAGRVSWSRGWSASVTGYSLASR